MLVLPKPVSVSKSGDRIYLHGAAATNVDRPWLTGMKSWRIIEICHVIQGTYQL